MFTMLTLCGRVLKNILIEHNLGQKSSMGDVPKSMVLNTRTALGCCKGGDRRSFIKPRQLRLCLLRKQIQGHSLLLGGYVLPYL